MHDGPPTSHIEPTPTPAATSSLPRYDLLEQQHANGVRWFYWIAALSVINSVLMLQNSTWSFILGLGLTQFIDGVSRAMRDAIPDQALLIGLITVSLDAGIAAVIAFFGWLARRGQVWAIILGMLLYAGDGLIFLLVGDWPSLGFHAFALWNMYAGLQALERAERLPPNPAAHVHPIGQRRGIVAWWYDDESREQLKRSARRLGIIALVGVLIIGAVQLGVILLA